MAKLSQIKIALAGNPNCGKTTIFNNITGAKQHVGNYPGVTVEKKVGLYTYNGYELEFNDLPGTYSLTARSMDELVARNAIINDNPDVIVNVVDASNMERNLYLTAQLIELEKPMVIVLNMADVAKSMQVKYDVKRLATETGAIVVETIGRKNIGTKDLLEAIVEAAKSSKAVTAKVNYGQTIEPQISELMDAMVAAGTVHYPHRWAAVKLLEGDADVVGKIMRLEKTETVLQLRDSMRNSLDKDLDLDTVFQEYRYEYASKLFNTVLTEAVPNIETQSDRIDKVLTHRVWGLPIFALIMFVLFYLVIMIGAYPQDWLDQLFSYLSDVARASIPEGQLQSLIVDGIIAGVGAVLSFLPLVVLLFLGISFLEDTGYMARAAFIMDRIMRAFGLHGKSFIPLLLGFGCSIPAIMGTRILDNFKDRMVTILVTPLMSCSARLPVYVLMATAFFPIEYSPIVLFCTYAFGVLLAICVAKVFRHTLFSGEAEPFVMEMPPYHIPTIKSVLQHMWERSWLYIRKAGTFILTASIIVWFVTSYPENVEYSQDYDAAHEAVTQTYEQKDADVFAQFNITDSQQQEDLQGLKDELVTIGEDATAAAEDAGEDAPELVAENPEDANEVFTAFKEEHAAEFPVVWSLYQNQLAMDDENDVLDRDQAAEKLSQSYAAQFGKAIEPVLEPLGFDWKIGVSLIAGMAAKEVIIATLGTIYAVGGDDVNPQPITDYLASDPHFTPLIAIAMLAFIVVYPPCIAALAVVKRETGSWKWMCFSMVYGVALAYVVALIIYQVGKALGF